MRALLIYAVAQPRVSGSFRYTFAGITRVHGNEGNEARTRFFHASAALIYSPAKRSAYGIRAVARTHIACDVYTTGKWCSREPNRGHAVYVCMTVIGPYSKRAQKSKLPAVWIGKGAHRRRPSLPETRLAACGFALPLFSSLLFYQGDLYSLLSFPHLPPNPAPSKERHRFVGEHHCSSHPAATLLYLFCRRWWSACDKVESGCF